MIKPSVVISAYNAENFLEECLQSVQDIAQEIIVVNSGSTDNTLAIAKKYTKHIFTKENNPMLNANKNFGFTKAKGEWILNLDPDERVTPELAKEIKEVIQKDGEVSGYFIARKNIIFGKWIAHGIWWPDYQMRLFKKSMGKFPEKHVHEAVEVMGQTEKLENPMIHKNYQTISQYLQKVDKLYTDNEAENFLAQGKKLIWPDAITMPANDFFKTFFLQKGFLDGLHGLVLSLLQAVYTFVVFAKVWEKQGFWEYNSANFVREVNGHIKKVAKDYNYWIFTTIIDQAKNPVKKLVFKVKRKLR